MKTNKHEKGQALIFIMAAIIGLIALTGLTVDGGLTYLDRQSAQSSADSAAIGAALAKVRSQNMTTAALSIAAVNGYTNDATHDTVTVTNPITAATTGCNGQSILPVEYRTAEYVHVKIITNVNAYFAPVVGVTQMHNCVEAIARAVPGVTGNTGGGLFDGNAVVALSNTESPAIKANGNATVQLVGGGMFSNSSASGSTAGASVWINESSIQISAPMITAVGSIDNDSAVPESTGAAQYDITPDYFSFIPAPPAKPTCASAAPARTTSGNTYTYYPGNYTASVSTLSSKTAILTAGTYCFTKGATFSGPVTGQGTVKIVLSGTLVGYKLEVGGANNWNDLEIYADKVGLKIASGASLTANRLRFYGAGTYGTAEVGMIGTSTIDVNDAYFYFQKGILDWNGNTSLNLQAPTSGDYKGLLVYMPLGNTGTTASYLVNGNSTTYSTGTWLMPSVDMGTNGNSSMNSLHSQFVVNTMQFNGNCDFKVNYAAGENAGGPATPSSPPAVELVK